MRLGQRPFTMLVACASILAAAPDRAEAEWHLTPLFGLTFRGETTILYGTERVHWNLGGATTLIGEGILGVEAFVVYTPGLFRTEDEVQQIGELVIGSRSLAVMGNVVLAAPRQWNEYGLRPFVSGGVGLIRASVTELVAGTLPVRENLFGYNIGGGAVGFLTERTGLRFDLRRFSGRGGDSEIALGFPVRLSYWSGSVGVAFRF